MKSELSCACIADSHLISCISQVKCVSVILLMLFRGPERGCLGCLACCISLCLNGPFLRLLLRCKGIVSYYSH